MATLTISNPSLKTGDVLSFTFSGFSKNSTVWVGVVGGGGTNFATNSLGNGSGAFQIGEAPGTYTLEAYDDFYYASATFTVTAVTGTWTLLKTVNIVAVHKSPAASTLTCTSSLVSGGTLSFSFTGFTPYASVYVGVVGGGGINVTANSSGNGSGSFIDGDPAGSYTLRASDSYGKVATTTFTVTAPAQTWQLLSTVYTMAVHKTAVASLACAASVQSGQSLGFSFTNFTPNAQVYVQVVGGSGTTVIANSSGAGSGSLIVTAYAGSHTLQAIDNYGKSATVSFTVTLAPQNWVSLSTVNVQALHGAAAQTWLLLSTVNTLAVRGAAAQTWVLLSTVNVPVIHTANLLGWQLLTSVSMQAVHTANLLGWQLLTTAIVPVLHTANLLGWQLLTSVSTQVTVTGGEEPDGGGTPGWLLPAALIGGAAVLGLAAGNSDKAKALTKKIPSEFSYKSKEKT